MSKTKEEILNKQVGEIRSNPLGEIWYCDAIAAMQSFADQEKEKVAVAFAEWKDEFYYKSKGRYRHKGDFYKNDKTKTISDLYQYFIENIYNK